MSNCVKINWQKYQNLSDEEIEKKIPEIMNQMTLLQKCKQMAGDGSNLLGLIIMGYRYNYKPLPAGELKEFGLPGIYFSDGPRGIVLNSSTCFPVSMARGATWDPALEERVGNAMGIEGRSQGADYFGGVCINLPRHPAWGRSQESYGDDPYHLGKMGVGLVKGIQNHMMACIKHYALNSMENARFKVDVLIDERTLREIYLPHFKMCIDAGAASVMCAYNKMRGEFCGQNSYLLSKILKEDWNFQGFVLSDFTFAVRDGKAAIKGGMDIEMPFKFKMHPKKIVKWVQNGEIPESLIDEAVIRILRQKLRFNKSRDPSFYNKNKVVCEEHVALAHEVAQKSMVLLKNEKNLLPLDREKIHKIAVIGALAKQMNVGDKGSSRVRPPYIVSHFDGISKAAQGKCEILYQDGKNLTQAIDVAKNAEVVVLVVGYTFKDEGEYIVMVGGDRKHLTLKSADEKLIQSIAATNPNCIVVMVGGSAIITENWRKSVPTILMSWYSGMEGGTALGEILFGDINPSGRLPLPFPKSEADLPFFDRNAKQITYDYWHGYRKLDKDGKEAAFPFGFGMSYTTFKYSNLKVTQDQDIKIKVDISNTGTREGIETVQCYIGYPKSPVERALKELKGFVKLIIKAGETKTAEIQIKITDLAYYHVEDNSWKVVSGEYSIMVGSSSNLKDCLTTTIKIIQN